MDAWADTMMEPSHSYRCHRGRHWHWSRGVGAAQATSVSSISQRHQSADHRRASQILNAGAVGVMMLEFIMLAQVSAGRARRSIRVGTGNRPLQGIGVGKQRHQSAKSVSGLSPGLQGTPRDKGLQGTSLYGRALNFAS